MADKPIVFYSWQSDVEQSATHYFIQRALQDAASEIAKDAELDIVPVIDRDTSGLSGSPNIKEAIFAKIDRADVFVADVTQIGRLGPKKKPSPNPNVLIELGYAIQAVGWDRIILVANTAFGKVDNLPFDLRSHRVTDYKSPKVHSPDRSKERRELQKLLREALLAALKAPPPRYKMVKTKLAELTMRYEQEPVSNGEQHLYKLHLKLKNLSTATVSKWHIDVLIPRAVLRPNVIISQELQGEGTETHALFRFKSNEGFPRIEEIYPKGTIEKSIVYHMTNKLFWSRDWEDEYIEATAYMNDEQVAEAKWLYKEWSDF